MKSLFNRNNTNINNELNNIELLDNKKYIVLEFWSGFKEWRVVSESGAGVSHLDAQTISNYAVKYGKTDPRKLMIVEVPEI